MCRVFDVVDFFIDSALDDPENNMTNMRINKLLYFAHGWSLERHGRPLFKEDIRAWEYGPVVKKVYNRLRFAGSNKINDTISGTYEQNLTADERDLLVDVMLRYDRYSTSGLVEITHRPGSPWFIARQTGKDELISQQSMQEYFAALPPLERFTLPPLTATDIVGHYDEQTESYVLPKEWDDDDY